MDRIVEEDLLRIVSDTTIKWESFRNSTVLVTGANGMIPAYLVWTFLFLNRTRNYGIRVVALVRNRQKAEAKFRDCFDDASLKLFVQDVSEKIEYDGPVDYIFHAAGQSSPKYYGVDPVGTINANVLGTQNTLALAHEKKVKSYIFFSSGEVYGTVSKEKVGENDYGYLDILKVRSCYPEGKRLGENLCVAWHSQYGVPAKIIRVFHMYGPGMQQDDGRTFADFTKNIVNNENILLHSDGSAVRLFCYMTDGIRAVFKVLLDGENARAYNVANEYGAVSIRELADILVGLYPEKNLRVETVINPDAEVTKMQSPISVLLPDCTRLYELGWQPEISVKEGFLRTVDYHSRAWR